MDAFKTVQVLSVKANSFKAVREQAREAGLGLLFGGSANKLPSYYCTGVHPTSFKTVQPADFETGRAANQAVYCMVEALGKYALRPFRCNTVHEKHLVSCLTAKQASLQ